MSKPTPIDKPLHRQTVASSSTTKTRFANPPWLFALILVALTFVVYFPVLRGGFVFDDDSLIVHNRLIHATDGLHQFWFTTEAGEYLPLTYTLWWLEWRSSGVPTRWATTSSMYCFTPSTLSRCG